MKKLLLLLSFITLPVVAMSQKEQEQMLQYNSDVCLQQPMVCVNAAYEFNLIRLMDNGEYDGYATPKNMELKRKIYAECYRFYVIQYYNDWKRGEYTTISPEDVYVQ